MDIPITENKYFRRIDFSKGSYSEQKTLIDFLLNYDPDAGKTKPERRFEFLFEFFYDYIMPASGVLLYTWFAYHQLKPSCCLSDFGLFM